MKFNWRRMLLILWVSGTAVGQQVIAPAREAVGSPAAPGLAPRLTFAFEFRVTLSPAVTLGDTAFGHRQYIPISGGSIAGPKLTGDVNAGGWDYQLGLADGCTALSADYFIRTRDGALIHVLNEGLACPGRRNFFRPRFEAPKGPYEWLTRATFIATLELEPSVAPLPQSPAPALNAIRLKFYQVE